MDSGLHPHPGNGQLCQLAKFSQTREVPPAVEEASYFVNFKLGWGIFLPGIGSHFGYLVESYRLDSPGTGFRSPRDQVAALPISVLIRG